MGLDNMPVVLCISGMHRSGTSLTASWLEYCDFLLHDGLLLEPDNANPKGYYEDLDFVQLHEDAIQAIDSNADGWKLPAKKSYY